MSGGKITHEGFVDPVGLAIRGGKVTISGGTLSSNRTAIKIFEDVNASVTIKGNSTLVKGSSSYYTISWAEGSSGTMTVTSSSTTPIVYNATSGKGIYYDSSSNVTRKISSGSVS